MTYINYVYSICYLTKYHILFLAKTYFFSYNNI